MTTVLLVGTGAVGVRAARQLVDTPSIERVLLASRGTPEGLAEMLGAKATATTHRVADAVPEGVDAVASALPAEPDAVLARRCIDAGVPVASVVDGAAAIDRLLALDDDARRAGITVAAGCGLAPGLADVLARHAADALDGADGVRVARSGVAGAASLASLRRERRETGVMWVDGGWRRNHRSGAELVWFPDPIGAHDCYPVGGGVRLLVQALPDVELAGVRADDPPSRSLAARLRRMDAGWGATRVEVSGWRGRGREILVYGVVERTAVAAGTVLALTAALLSGAVPELERRMREPGVYGLGALVEPAPFLAELARRGVKAAVFEGVAVA